MHLWVGEAIMPQITTWLIVSEQMSRLSEIRARPVRKPPPSSESVDKAARVGRSIADENKPKKKKKQKFKTSEINKNAREGSEVRCSPGV